MFGVTLLSALLGLALVLVRGAQRPAGAALLERGAVPAVRHPRLRQQFHLGFAEPDVRRVLGGAILVMTMSSIRWSTCR